MVNNKHISNQPIIIPIFVYLAAFFLLVAATAKLASAGGGVQILQVPDPIFFLPFKWIFVLIGGLECIIALVCFFSRWLELKAGLLAWLATSFLFYRLGLIWVGYHKPCSCLGNLTDALHIAPQTADTAMKIVLAYLLIGSYATLFWLWRQKRKTVSATASSETSAPSPAP